MPYELRPLTLAELLDRAFGLYRRHFWLFVGIMALPSLAMLILSVGSQFLEGAATLARRTTDRTAGGRVPGARSLAGTRRFSAADGNAALA